MPAPDVAQHRYLDTVAGREREPLEQLTPGRNLACWCALNGPCHADLLLTLANGR
jgi:hypothetical protein